jgi:hypothetical protein
MYTQSNLTANLNRNRIVPPRPSTIGGQIIPQRQVPETANNRTDFRSVVNNQPLQGPETLPHWTSEEIDKRLSESAKLLQEWTDLMNKTGNFVFVALAFFAVTLTAL